MKTLLHARRKGKNIDYKSVFGPDVDSGHPYAEEVAWLRQWVSIPESGYYLVEGSDTYPTRIWRGEKNDINAFFHCIWERTEEQGDAS